MKYYAIGLTKALTTEELMECCGSFTITEIDGRLTMDNAIEVGKDWFEKNKKINHMLGFRLFRAVKPSKCITPVYIYNPTKLPIREWDN